MKRRIPTLPVTRPVAILAALLLSLYFASTALAAMGVVDWEYSFVNMRSAPSTGAKKILRIPSGTELRILEDKGEWLLIGHAGKQGWVVSRSVQRLKPSAAPAQMAEENVKAPELVLSRTAIEESDRAAAASQPSQSSKPSVLSEEVINPAANSESANRQAGSEAAQNSDGDMASNAGTQQQAQAVHVGATLANVFIGLLAVLGLVGGIAWAVRRFFTGQPLKVQDNPAIRILTTLPLNSRQTLMLAEVGGEAYLLAQSEGGVDLLTKIESPEALERLDGLLKFKAKAGGTASAGLKQQGSLENFDDDGDRDGADADKKEVSPEERLKMLRRRPNDHED